MKPIAFVPCLPLVALLLSGCASPGVVQLSPDTYMLSKSSAAGAFTNLPKLKAAVVREANDYATSKGKMAVVVSMHDTFPTHGFPSVEYQFRLVDNTNNATPHK